MISSLSIEGFKDPEWLHRTYTISFQDGPLNDKREVGGEWANLAGAVLSILEESKKPIELLLQGDVPHGPLLEKIVSLHNKVYAKTSEPYFLTCQE